MGTKKVGFRADSFSMTRVLGWRGRVVVGRVDGQAWMKNEVEA